MAKDKKSVIIYVDWITTFNELEDIEAGQLIKHLFRYVNDQNPEPPNRLIKLLFEPIKQILKRDLKRYEDKCLKNIDNVNKRWNKNNTVVCDGIKSDTKHTDNDNDNDNDNDKIEEIISPLKVSKEPKQRKKREVKIFAAPCVDEIQGYFVENGYTKESALKAWNYYNVANWHDSKNNPVLNWKQKMITVWFKPENKSKDIQIKEEMTQEQKDYLARFNQK